MPAEVAAMRRGGWVRSLALLGAWAAALALGEQLALRASGWLWSFETIREADAGSLPFYGPLLLGLIFLTALFPRRVVTPWLPRRWTWLGVAALLGALAFNSLGGTLRQTVQGRPFPAFHGPKSWVAFFAGGLLGPLVEEWIFRGVLWQLARDAVDQRSPSVSAIVATLFTAIAFAAWHIPFAGYVFFDYNLAFGSFLGLARWALGGTAPGVVVHILGNAFYLLTG